MRNSKSHTNTIKKKLSKSKNVFYAYTELQFKYGLYLDSLDSVLEITSNVKLLGLELGDTFTTDFVVTKSNGQLMVRECVDRYKLNKPLTMKMLDASRNYWLSKGIKDWGIVVSVNQ